MNLSSGLKVISVAQADDRLDAFWEAFCLKKEFYTIARTSDYLNWRIFENPNMLHELWAVTVDDVIQGYVILGINRRENVGYIVDICVLNQYYEEVAGLLMSHAVKYFRSRKIAYVDAWHAGKNQETKTFSSLLRKSGFITLPMGSSMVMKTLVAKESLPADPGHMNQWFITHLFSEGVG